MLANQFSLLFYNVDCGATHMTEKKIQDHILKEEGVSVEDVKRLVLPPIAE